MLRLSEAISAAEPKFFGSATPTNPKKSRKHSSKIYKKSTTSAVERLKRFSFRKYRLKFTRTGNWRGLQIDRITCYPCTVTAIIQPEPSFIWLWTSLVDARSFFSTQWVLIHSRIALDCQATWGPRSRRNPPYRGPLRAPQTIATRHFFGKCFFLGGRAVFCPFFARPCARRGARQSGLRSQMSSSGGLRGDRIASG